MNLPTLVTDNITELLLKIIEFTQARQKILIQNINAMHTDDFVPKDLPVDEFSRVMLQALNEHAHSQRLLLQDGRNIKFGAGGSFKTTPIIDEEAKRLFEQDRDEYLRGQISKLLENSLNQRIATELLKQNQSEELCLGRCLN
jgi:flagellar basal body rod protein FlgB